MPQGFPIYGDLIVRLDPNNANKIRAQLRQTLSMGSLNIDILKDANVQQFENALKKVRIESKGVIGDMQELGRRVDRVFGRFSAYLIASGGILSGISLFKSGIEQALKFNSELIRVRQISGDSQSAVKSLGDEIGRLARNYGVASSELVKSAVTLKQAGLSVREVKVALEALSEADLAPNFDSMAKTTEGVIAIYQQFGKNIDNVKAQLAGLNAVAGEYAVEASDLITLIQKAGGAARSSGADIAQLAGLFTSVRATTRESADSIATGLRTIFGRLQRPDTIKFLDELGIKMRVTAEEAKDAGKNVGDFVGPFEAILRLSEATQGLGSGSILFANIIEQVGGLRQISRVVPLIKEAGTTVEAYNVFLANQNSLYAAGLIKQEYYLNKLTKIKEEFLSIIRAFTQTEGFDKFVSVLGTIARSAIQVVDALSPILPIIATLSTINIGAGIITGFASKFGARSGITNYPSTPRAFAGGGIIPGHGNSDSYPAVLMPGEAVIPKKSVQKFPQLISGLISGTVPGMAKGGIFELASDISEEARLRRIARLLGIPENRRAGITPSIIPFAKDTSSVLDFINPGTQLDKTVSPILAEQEKIAKNYRSAITNKFSSFSKQSNLRYNSGNLYSPEQLFSEFNSIDKQRQSFENQNRLHDMLLAQKQAQGAMRSGNIGNLSRAADFALLNPAITRTNILNTQIGQGMIDAGNYGPIGFKQPFGGLSLPVIGGDTNTGAYTKAEAYNLMAAASAGRGNTIPNINAAAALYNAGGQNVASYSNGPVGAFGFGRNPPTPPIGPFGYGRGSGGGGSGGSGGTGAGGAGANGIPIEKALSGIGVARWLDRANTLGGFGLPLGLAAYGANSKDQGTQTKANSTAAYAGIGGAIGSALPIPGGTLIGAAIGAVYGWFEGAEKAAKELEKTATTKKIDEAMNRLSKSLQDLAEGRGSLSDLADSLENTRKASVGEALRRSRNGESFVKASNEEFQKAAGINLAKYEKQIAEEVKRQAKGAGTLNLGGEDNQKLIRNIVALRQREGTTFTPGDYQKEQEKLFRGYRTEAKRSEADTRFVTEINKSISSATSFAEAVQRAAEAADKFDDNFKAILGGGYANPSFKVGPYGAINQGVLGRFGGLGFGQLASEVSGVNTVNKFLPEVLSRIIKPGAVGNTDEGSLSDALQKTFENITKSGGPEFNQKIIAVLANKLESIKTDQLFEDFKKAPEQFAKTLIESYEPARKALESIGHNLEERDSVYQQGLRNLLQINDRINQIAENISHNQIAGADIGSRIQIFNRGLDPSRFSLINNARIPFGQEQDRLLGTEGIGLDANSIISRIRQEEANRDTLRMKAQQEAELTGGRSRQFADQLYESEKRLMDYNKALENLTKRTEELSRLNQEISIQEKVKSSKTRLQSDLLTANPQELLKMNQDFMAVGLTTRLGIGGVKNLGRQAGFRQFGFNQAGAMAGDFMSTEMLKRARDLMTGPLADQKMKTKTGEIITYKEGWDRLVKNAGGNLPKGLQTGPEDTAIKDALNEIAKINSTSTEALKGIADTATKQQASLYEELKKGNQEFFKKMDEYIRQLQDNALGAEEGRTRTQLNELEPQMKGIEGLRGQPVDLVRKQIGIIKSFKEAEAENERNRGQVPGLLEDFDNWRNMGGKKTPEDLIENLKGRGASPEILKAIEARQKEKKRLELEATSAEIQAKINEVPQLFEKYSKEAEEAKKKNLGFDVMDPAAIRQIIEQNQGKGSYNRMIEARKRMANPGLVQVTDEGIKFAEEGKNPTVIQRQFQEAQKRLMELERQRRGLVPNAPVVPGASNFIPGIGGINTNGEVPQRFNGDPRLQNTIPNRTIDGNPNSSPAPGFQRGNQLGPNLGFLNDIGRVLTDFSQTFGKTVAGLGNIPKSIDMNVNQKVEVILNGADVLTRLNPTMQTVADGAVAKAVEAIGSQLRGYNITIKYSPTEAA